MEEAENDLIPCDDEGHRSKKVDELFSVNRKRSSQASLCRLEGMSSKEVLDSDITPGSFTQC